jgi:hypothetical protein
MKLLAVFLLHGPHQKLDELFFPGWKFLKHPYVWTCSVRGGFTSYSSYFILLTTERSTLWTKVQLQKL